MRTERSKFIHQGLSWWRYEKWTNVAILTGCLSQRLRQLRTLDQFRSDKAVRRRTCWEHWTSFVVTAQQRKHWTSLVVKTNSQNKNKQNNTQRQQQQKIWNKVGSQLAEISICSWNKIKTFRRLKRTPILKGQHKTCAFYIFLFLGINSFI